MNWDIKGQSTLGLCIVALLIGFVGIWGTFARLAGAVIAVGQVEPQNGSQVVQHPDGGSVVRINVKDGDKVSAGDLLLALDGGALRSQKAIIDTQRMELGAEIARLTTEQEGGERVSFPDDLRLRAEWDPVVAEVIRRQGTIFVTRLSTLGEAARSLQEQKNGKRSEAAGLLARAKALGEQLVLLEAELAHAHTLQNKGLIQASRVFELERATKGLAGDIAGSKASAAAAESEIARLDVEAQRLTVARQEEVSGSLRDTENRLRELDGQDRELARRIEALGLRAPSSGIIHGLQVHALGAVVRPADPVLYVVPQDEPLAITARIDANHVDAIYVGQDAMVRFTSFDARLTPELSGAVLRISPDTVTDNRTGATYYTAEIALNAGEVQKLGDKVLLPGMRAEVYIQTGSRSPVRYILKPFLDFVGRAGKE